MTRKLYAIAVLLAVVGIGILLYWWWIARPLWVDEEMLALNVRDRGILDFGTPQWLDQAAPLGWLILERIAWLSLGASERAMRALPVLFGIGTLATCVWIGRRWMTPLGAAVLVVLCSLGQWIVFFNLELKHYSSDVFWALLLPALAAWALEDGRHKRRIVIWWVLAAVGLWLGNGALFVVPACSIILVIECWRLYGVRFAIWTAAVGAVWLMSFALSYAFALRHVLNNVYLQSYWAFAFPPPSAGPIEQIRWIANLLVPFAIKPGGSGHPVLFWIAAIAGLAFAIVRRQRVGLFFAAIPVSAIAFGLLRIVPPIERLGLWAVPSLYVGIAFCSDASIWFLMRHPIPPPEHRKHSRGESLWMRAATVAAVIVAFVTYDIVKRGEVDVKAKPLSNYGLDDRSSVRRTLALQQPGDVLLTTHFGLAGVWWYGRLDVSTDDRGGHLPNGNPIVQIHHVPAGPSCAAWNEQLDRLAKDYNRVVVNLGFRMNVEPPGFDTLVLQELARRGRLIMYQRYGEVSRVAVFDMRQPPLAGGLNLKMIDRNAENLPSPGGCVETTPARRW